ncbi:MAG: DoxX family membrane protein [Propionibacteriaceae bacterium]|jgi:uncharacterized membrane protein YphA (DoxX/SURF4 family)|nr:DoxX family membrane protein [Propionibacteriaceae bacterium]
MSLMRLVARSMLAGYFITDGVDTIRHPEQSAQQLGDLAARVQSAGARLLPEKLAKRLPQTPEAFVRAHAIAQVVGAGAMASGIGRRGGASLLALAYLPRVLNHLPRSVKQIDRAFWRELALLGGLLIEARDTQGKPDVRWWVSQQGRLTRQQSQVNHQLEKHGAKPDKHSSKRARQAA